MSSVAAGALTPQWVLLEINGILQSWCVVLSSPFRESCPTSHPLQTWGVWTQSGSSWWSGGSCLSWALQDASERSVKTRSYSSLYVEPCYLHAVLYCRHLQSELSSVFLLQFSVFLGIIFFLELTTGILAFVFKDWIKDQLNLFINNNIRAYRDDIDLQNLIDFTQEYVSQITAMTNLTGDKEMGWNLKSHSEIKI